MSDTGIEIESGEFYHLDLNGTESVFATREAAVTEIADSAVDIDIETATVDLVCVDTSGTTDDEDGNDETEDSQWTIEVVPWRKIALQVLQGQGDDDE